MSFLGSLKKLTIKKVIGGVAKVVGAVPVIGGALKTGLDLVSQTKSDATKAQAVAAQQLQPAPAAAVATPTGIGGVSQNTLMLIGGALVVFLLLRHR